MDKSNFEALLSEVCEILSREVLQSDENHKPKKFEQRVRAVFSQRLAGTSDAAAPNIDQGFPDIVIGAYGVEVKATESDRWRCIANSVSEGQRAPNVDHVYIVYGKFGGTPEVRWADYGQSIVHVRTSHVPRFEVEIGTQEPLFDTLGTTYEAFCKLDMDEKMPYIRTYARGRRKPGERLWWLEDQSSDDAQHSLPLTARSILQLDCAEKRKLRAEATLLVPAVLSPSRSKAKSAAYVDAAMFWMTYRGVLAHQTRDFFSAGSVGEDGPFSDFVQNATWSIQAEIRAASEYLEDALLLEYWGYTPPRSERLSEWLKKADQFAKQWRPSEVLQLLR